MENRNHLVDILRFFAVTWVSIFHFNEPIQLQDNWYRDFTKIGHLGVPMFFVISGYCIALSANHTQSMKDFILRRFFRIFPAYWLSLFIVLLAVIFSLLAYGANSVAELPNNLIKIIATLTILTKPFSSIATVNWVYWSLTVEIFFYIIISLSIIIQRKLRFLWIIIISILPFFLNDETGFLFFVKYWPAFLLGFSTYYLITKLDFKNMLLLILSLVTLAVSISHSNQFKITCLITICIIVYGHFKPFKKNAISSIGDYSYATYLIHVPIGVNILGYVKQYNFIQQNIFANILWDTLSYIIILFMARLIYLKFELPIIIWGKKYAKKDELSPLTTAIN